MAIWSNIVGSAHSENLKIELLRVDKTNTSKTEIKIPYNIYAEYFVLNFVHTDNYKYDPKQLVIPLTF